jgi:DNA repair photolyase
MCNERQYYGQKPVYQVPAKNIINFKSGFGHKKLCDDLTFSAGSACAFSCSFCYVESLMFKNPHTMDIREKGIPFEDVVIRREGAVEAVTKQLLNKKGEPKFKDPEDKRVIYASPLVDVAANMELVKETIKICKVILEYTNWQIRLLSKSTLIYQVAKGIPEKWKNRMIYGLSIGTLNDKLALAFEVGTAKPSKRVKTHQKLQDEGYRVYGMACPILPVENIEEYADAVVKALRVDRCEHVWAEVLNSRGRSMERMHQSLSDADFVDEANRLQEISEGAEAWENKARETFEALANRINGEKLRFMQYPKKKYLDWWKPQVERGALLLGKIAESKEDE